MTIPHRRFQNPAMQEQYEFALARHDLMMSGGNGGRTAYKRGYTWPDRRWGYRGTMAEPQWQAGIDNRRSDDAQRREREDE
jgi:hypothetical protein